MIPKSTHESFPSIGSRPHFPISDFEPISAPNSDQPSSPTATTAQASSIHIPVARIHSDEAIRTLFQLIQNRNLDQTEKNIHFAQLLAKIQLTSIFKLRVYTQFTARQLTFRLCSPNAFEPREIEDVEDASVPFCILNPLFGSQEASGMFDVPRLDFRSIVLPERLCAEINSNELYKRKAQVDSIQTLQEWAHGFTHSLDLPLPDAMPPITGDSYKVAAFVPVKIEDERSVTCWNPYVRGATGPKMLFSYSANQGETSCGKATPGMSRRNNYIPVQSQSERNFNWPAHSFAFAEDELEDVIARIKRATMNFAVLPVHPVEPYPVIISSPPRTSRNSAALQPPLTYGSYHATGRHSVESQNAVHLQISPIPIDVTGIDTQEQLIKYLQRLASVVKKLESPAIEAGSRVEIQPNQRSPRTRNTPIPLKNFMQNILNGIWYLAELIANCINSFFLTRS